MRSALRPRWEHHRRVGVEADARELGDDHVHRVRHDERRNAGRRGMGKAKAWVSAGRPAYIRRVNATTSGVSSRIAASLLRSDGVTTLATNTANARRRRPARIRLEPEREPLERPDLLHGSRHHHDARQHASSGLPLGCAPIDPTPSTPTSPTSTSSETPTSAAIPRKSQPAQPQTGRDTAAHRRASVEKATARPSVSPEALAGPRCTSRSTRRNPARTQERRPRWGIGDPLRRPRGLQSAFLHAPLDDD